MTSFAAAKTKVMGEERNTNDAQERDALIEEIARRAGVRAERGRRFAELTSLRVGGEIDWLFVPETEAQAAAVVGQNVAARAQHSPSDARLFERADDGRSLALGLGNQEPIDLAADAQ